MHAHVHAHRALHGRRVQQGQAGDTWYLMGATTQSERSTEATLNFLTFLVLIDLLVPISLYVSMEMVKFVQAKLIDYDLGMYDARSDTPAKARTSNLNEELGQVTHVFSDKTGTLTQNVMTFARCSVRHLKFGKPLSSEPKRAHDADSRRDRASFDDPRLLETLRSGVPHESAAVDLFLTLLATCHSVVVDEAQSLPGRRPVFAASSPDEKALVSVANDHGYAFRVCDRPCRISARAPR